MGSGSALFSIALPPQRPFFSRSLTSPDCCFHPSRASVRLSSSAFITSLSSSSSASSSIAEDEGEKDFSAVETLTLQSESSIDDVDNSLFSGCKVCGREEIEKGCNGEGRIQGGIATVPGFGWWPIKAYRPCPAFIASGGRYKRRGQSMDEVASGAAKKPVARINLASKSQILGNLRDN